MRNLKHFKKQQIDYLIDWTGTDFNATDYLLNESTWAVNDTRFKINETGYLDTGSLGAGNYSVEVSINDSSNNKGTKVFKLIINKITPTASLTNSRDWSFTYDGTPADIGISESNSGDGDVSYILWKDDVNVGSSDSEGTAGSYDYKINTTGGQNYSSVDNMDTDTLTISKATTSLGLVSSMGWNIPASNYAEITGTNCPTQLTCNLYQEGVEVSNPYTDLFSAGSYDFKYNTSGNINYTSDSISQTLNVNVNATLVDGMECYLIETATQLPDDAGVSFNKRQTKFVCNGTY